MATLNPTFKPPERLRLSKDMCDLQKRSLSETERNRSSLGGRKPFFLQLLFSDCLTPISKQKKG